MNPYQHLVSEYARLLREGKSYALGGFAPSPRPAVPPDAPVALIFSPHPDDECIIGALALRLLREAGARVVNVAVTLGSKKSRRNERLGELEKACGYLGFDLMPAGQNGLENVTLKTRADDPAAWAGAVKIIADVLAAVKPRILFLPHDQDWHETHIGTHFLVMDALKILPADFTCMMIETEFWGAMATPNLMVESGEPDVADLVTALSFHIGEVRRNPYHLLLPAWMQDNVRRGGELVGGKAGAAPDFVFATLYRLRQWQNGRLEAVNQAGRQLSQKQNPTILLAGV